jgi:FtsH-binding integral membrane protein
MQSIPMERTQSQVQVNAFVRSVYNWMAIGLALTGGVAWFVAHNEPVLQFVIQARWIFFIGTIGLVFMLAGRVHKMKASTATGMFMLYAALNGATMSFIFLIYTMTSIASTFFICAGTFAVCSVFGWVTKRDLTGLGSFMFMGFIGIFIASIVNLFLKSPGMQMIISYIGVLVFTGLTAYDTQKLKSMAIAQPAGLDAAVVRKGAIIGALTLYLDFILMFQYMLMIFGGSRD